MQLLRNNSFVADAWVALGDDDAIADGTRVIISFVRLQRDWDQLAKYSGLIGVHIPNTTRAQEVLPFLSKIALLVLSFPAFTDGRSYSLARQLRLDGYRGELRATGNLLPDQMQYMLQVGFESFEVSERFSLEAWQKAARQMALTYQRGLTRAGNEKEVWSQRHQGFAAWEEQPHAG